MRKWSMPMSAIALATIVVVVFAGAPAAQARAAAPKVDTRLVVTSSADHGPGTLRTALASAQARPGGDTIAFATKKPIRLVRTLPAITDALTITGSRTEIVGPGSGNGFVVRSNDVTITGLTLRGFTTAIRIERASRVTVTKNVIRDNRGAGVAIVGPTKQQVAAAVASHTLSLPELVALVPTHVIVRDNRIGPNTGAAVARTQDGIVHVGTLTDDGHVARGTVAHATGATTVELFANSSCAGAQPQAETRLGRAPVSAQGVFSFAHASSVGAITAIATDDMGGSSAVSPCARRLAAKAVPAPVAVKPITPTTTTTTVAPNAAPKPTTTTTVAVAAPRASARSQLSISSGRAFAAAAATASDCTTTFDGADLSTAWTDPLNWNPVGVPGPNAIACIPSNFGVVVSTGNASVGAVVVDGILSVSGGQLTIAQDSTIAALSITGGFLELDAPTKVTNSFAWTNGTVAGAGEVDLAATATGTWSTGGTKSLSIPIVNDGTIDWTGGQLQVRSDLGGIGNITNHHQFNINVSDFYNFCCGSTQPTLDNTATGTITKTGTGNLILNNVAIANSGTIDHQAGTITFNNNTTDTIAGNYTAQTGTTTAFNSGDWTFTHQLLADTLNIANGALHIPPNVNFQTVTINATGGTLDVNSTTFIVFNLNIAGGTITTSTTLEPFAQLNWNNGTLAGAGQVLIDSTVTANFSTGGTKSLSIPITNDGTINWTGGQLQVRSDLGGIGNITNHHQFNINVSDFYNFCCGSAQPVLDNTGTITKTGTGNLIFNNVAIANTGTIDHQQGTITFNNNTTDTIAGNYTAQTGTTTTFNSGDWTFTHQLLADTLNVSGGALRIAPNVNFQTVNINATGGTLDVNSTTFIVFNVNIAGGTITTSTTLEPFAQLNWNNGTLAGAGQVLIDSTVTANFSTGGTKSLSIPITNDGTIDWTGGQLQVRSDLGGIGNITNNKAFNINVSDFYNFCCGSTQPILANAGTITKTGTGNLILNNVAITNSGTIDHQQGTITFNNNTTDTIAGNYTAQTGTTTTFNSGDWTFTHQLLADTLNIANGALHIPPNVNFQTVTINATGGTLDVNSTTFIVFNVNIAGGTITTSTTLEPFAQLNWNNGTLAGAGQVLIDSTVTANFSTGGTKSLSIPITNDGTINWTGGQLQVRSDLGGIGNITNHHQFNINVSDFYNFCCGSAQPVLDNTGTITKTGTGNLIFNNVAIANSGTIDHQQGTITFNNNTTDTIAGNYTAQTGTTTTFNSGDWTFTHQLLADTLNVSGGALRIAPNVNFQTVTINATGGTLDVNSTTFIVFNVNIAGGTITTSTTLEPFAQLNWNNGTLAGAGQVLIDSTVTANFSTGGTKSLSIPIANNGTIDWTGGQLQVRSDLGGVGNITNNKAFNINVSDFYNFCCGNAQPTLDNTATGTITKTGTGNLILNNIGVTNTGTIDHQQGTITFNGTTPQTIAGTFDGAIGATTTFNAGDWTVAHAFLSGTLNVSGGTLHAASTTTSFGANTVNLTGGTLDLNTADNAFSVFTLNIAGGALSGTTNIDPITAASWTNGTISGPGSLTVDDSVTLTLSSGGTKSLSGPLVNNGTIDWSGGQLQVRSDLGGIGNVTNNGTFTISTNDFYNWCCGPNRPFFKNAAAGRIVRSGGGQTTVQGPSFENKGTLDVASGVMSFNTPLVDLAAGALTAGTWEVGASAALKIEGADFTGNAAHIALQGTDAVISDGVNNNALRHLATNDGTLELTGGAELFVNGDLANRGTITLGAPDTLNVTGAYTQSPTARLNVAIAESSIPGFDFSLLNVGAKATLSGTLGITTVAPFVPTDETFRIIDATSVGGSFSTLEGADLGSGVAYEPVYDSSAGDTSLTVNGVATVGFDGIAATTEFNGTVQVPFTLSHAMSVPVQVSYHTESGTAISDVDYSDVISATTIAAGATTGVAEVPILDDNLPEHDETFSIVIDKVDASGVPVQIGEGTQTVTIIDDDGPIPHVEIADTAISEGNVNLPVDISIDRTLPVDMQVSFTTQAGTATANDDYDTTTGTVTIPAGQTVAEAIIPIHDDTNLEPDETFTVHITGATSQAAFEITEPDALVTIVNDDTATPPTIVLVPETIPEGVGQYALHISGVGGDSTITVPITFADLTAKSPADYQRPGITTVTVAPNSTTTVLIPIVDDALNEADEVFAVDVGGTTAQFTIADNDPRPHAVIDDTDVVEGNSGTTNAVFTIRLVDSLGFGLPTPSGQSVQVQATTAAGTATEDADFQPIATVVTIPAGATSATVSVPVVGDTLDEGSENFTVQLGTVLNAVVDPNTFATGTIIDDDTPAGTGDVPSQLQQGSQTLLASLPNWGRAFDLDSSAGFETPVVTDQLASRLGTASALAHGVPALMPTPATDLGALLAQAKANGATVDWAEGGLGGSPTPPTANDFVQLRYTTTLANLAEAAGFTGDEFNDQTVGVLQGIASALGLDANLTITGDLAVTLVFGVDNGGFYVAPETALRLTVAANGSVAGNATLSGATGVSVSGTGDANLTVMMQLGTRARVADLSGDPHTLLHPRASGVAHLQLTATRDPLALTWSSTHTVTTDGTTTTVATNATLDGSLTLPSVAVTLHGTYDGATWQLHGTGAAATINGFTLDQLTGDATITPTSFTGSLDAVAHLDLGNGGIVPTGALHATFNGAALHASVHVDPLDQAVVIASTSLQLHSVGIDATFDADVDAQTNALSVKVHAATVSGAIHGALTFSLSDVTLTLGTEETAPILSITETTASLAALGGVTVTLDGFHVNRDGTFGATLITLHADALVQDLGLAGVLPFDLTDLQLAFPDHENLDNFTATIGGTFDTSAFSVLPFTPVIGIGCDPLRTTCPAQPHFSFAVAVDSLAGGDIALEETQPITIGFSNLPVGEATISADLTLGHYHLGQWVDEFGGTLAIGGISPTIGNASITVQPHGLDLAAHTLNISGEFDISAQIGDHVEIDNARLAFSLGVHFAHGFSFTGPTLDGLQVQTVKVGIGDFMTLTGANVDIHFAPTAGQNFAQFGALTVQFDQGAAALANWSASAGNFALDAHLTPIFLNNFFLQVTPPPGEHFGLPDYVPFHLDSVKLSFPGIDTAHPPATLSLDDLADFTLTVSGGIDANAQWPISASVQGLQVDFAKLARGEFPITNLQGLSMGMQPFELAPGFTIGGFLAFGTVDVDADPGPAVSTQTVFYGRIGGTFEFDGIGAGIDLVVSQYGPVLASVEVPLGIPLDGGTLGGIILANVKGGVVFGGKPLPNPQRPSDIIHDPAFNTNFPVTLQTIHDAVEPAVQTHTLTWHNGFTLTLSGTIVHALAPGVVSGHVTIGANIGLIPGQSGLKLIGHGDISVWGMPFAGAAVLIDLQDPIQPKFDLAFETPQVGNPLGFLLPAQTTFEVSLDTKGILPGFGLGVRTFLTQITQGSLTVGQSFFNATLDRLAASLQLDHSRPLAQLLLDTNGNGVVSSSENALTITRASLVSGVLARLALGANGLPANPTAAGQMAQTFAFEILDAAGHVTGFDLTAADTNADTKAFANILGRGGEAIAAMLGVTSKAVHNAGVAFFSQFDPKFSLTGAIQPVILGIPFGSPDHDVTVLITKTGLSFGFDTSITNIGKQLANMIVPFVGGAAVTAMTLGFEDHLGLTFQLPITGIIDGLFGGPGLPAIDPLHGNWAVQINGGMKFLGFDIAQMTGLVIGPNDKTFVDAHVQRVFLDPTAPLDPTRIPIATAAHYNALITYGGVLLTGRLLLPKLLTDPVALLSSLNLPVPPKVTDIPNWVAAVNATLTQLAQPARMQLFLPGLSSLLNFNFNAVPPAQRIAAKATGTTLATQANAAFRAAYIEGTVDGTLLSMPMGGASVLVQAGKVAVNGQIPVIGLAGTFTLDTNPTASPIGNVPLPRALATVTITAANVNGVLRKFGLPALVAPGTGGATFRAVSPGYNTTSTDALLRQGGLELATNLNLAPVVTNAHFVTAVTTSGNLNASAGVTSFQPIPGVTLTNGTVGFTKVGTTFAGSLGGTVQLPTWLAAALGVSSASATGTFNSQGQATLSITVNGTTYDLNDIFHASVARIVDLLKQAGKTFVDIATILFQNVTTTVATIVNQLVRIGAGAVDIADALFHGVGATVTTVVDQLNRIGISVLNIADALFKKVTTVATTIVDQLVRIGANYVQIADALFHKANKTITVVVDQLNRIGVSVLNIADALFKKVTTVPATIVDQLVRIGATYLQIADALVNKVGAGINVVADQLDRIGTSFAHIADALFQKVTTSVTTIASKLVREGASFPQVAAALRNGINASTNNIADALRSAGANFTQMIDALHSQLGISVNTALAQLTRLSANVGQIVNALVTVFNMGLTSLITLLVAAGFGVQAVTNAFCNLVGC